MTVEVTEPQATKVLRLHQMDTLLQRDRESAELRNHPFFRRELPEFLPEKDPTASERAIQYMVVLMTGLFGLASLASIALSNWL